jgi:Flp pilus assembly protein TadG
MLLSRFFRDKRASIVPLFALAIVPITGLVGAAVDYTRAAAARTAMQVALDSTALAVAKNAANENADQIQANADSYFKALFNRPEAQNVTVKATYDSASGSKVVVSASANIQTYFMSVMGYSTLPIAANSTSVWGNTRLRVALALDVTGSMASNNKMTAMKAATHNLLKTLKDAAQKDGDVYVSIIPFNKDVNVGPDKYEQSWVDWSEWNNKNGSCSKSWYDTQSSCTSNGGTWTAANHNTWTGCVMDRDQNYDTLNTAPESGALFPAQQYSSCPAALMPLSYDWTALNAKVDDLQPAGNTNQTIGLAWGWQSLSETSPLNAPAKDPKYKYQDIIILLTDGLNTQNRWSSNQSAIDTRMEKACDNAKAAKITIYTVLVMEGNASLLQNCASDQSKFFQLTSADEIITTFNTIGSNLTQLRIAK